MRHPHQCTPPSQLGCYGRRGGKILGGGGAAGTRESLLQMLLVVPGVPILVESQLSVCDDAPLDAIEELPELSEAVGSVSDELFASTTMRLCSLTARIGWVCYGAQSDTRTNIKGCG